MSFAVHLYGLIVFLMLLSLFRLISILLPHIVLLESLRVDERFTHEYLLMVIETTRVILLGHARYGVFVNQMYGFVI